MRNMDFLTIICCIAIGCLFFITGSIVVVFYNSITAKDSDLEQIRKATLFLLDDLYGGYLGELQHLSIDPGHDLGNEKRVKYLREQLQQIESFVNTLDPKRKAFDK